MTTRRKPVSQLLAECKLQLNHAQTELKEKNETVETLIQEGLNAEKHVDELKEKLQHVAENENDLEAHCYALVKALDECGNGALVRKDMEGKWFIDLTDYRKPKKCPESEMTRKWLGWGLVIAGGVLLATGGQLAWGMAGTYAVAGVYTAIVGATFIAGDD